MKFRPDYQQRLPTILSSIDSMPGSLDSYMPGMTKAKLKRFFQRFDVLLGRLDQKGAKQPQYLFYGGQSLPAHLSAVCDQSINHMPSGAGTFVPNNMAQLIEMQDRLERAVGTDVDELKRISTTTANDLENSVQLSDELVASIQENEKTAKQYADEADNIKRKLSENLEDIEKAVATVRHLRQTAETLTNPDGRNKNSLETLGRRAKERLSEIESVNAEIRKHLETSQEYLKEIENNSVNSSFVFRSLETTENDAKQILNLSSQAGLASSYKTEADRLKKQSNYFTSLLYCTALLTLMVAICYVIPELTKAISDGGKSVDFDQVLSLTFLRALTLGPLIYILFFTTKRISILEILRMDYAEKAAASLAYSGYKDQMTVDDDLLRQLKASLLSKFQDHPERLLRPEAISTRAKVSAPGFVAETTVESKSDPSSSHPEER